MISYFCSQEARNKWLAFYNFQNQVNSNADIRKVKGTAHKQYLELSRQIVLIY